MPIIRRVAISVETNPGFLLDSTSFDMPHNTRNMDVELAAELLQIREAMAAAVVAGREVPLSDLAAFFKREGIAEGDASAQQMARRDADALKNKFNELTGPAK